MSALLAHRPAPALGGDAAAPAEPLRDRLRILLLGRLLVVTVFLAAVLAMRLVATGQEVPWSGAALGAVSAAYALTLASAVLVRRVQRLERFAYVQVVFDVLLVTGAVALWGGAPGLSVLLYFLAIANAAGLLLLRGAVVTALASSLAYGALLSTRHAALAAAGESAASAALAAGFAALGLLAGAFMVGSLAARLARAEEELAERRSEVDRLEGMQRALANSLESGVLVADGAGRVRSANPAAQQILGLATTAVLGREITWLIPTLATSEESPDAPGAIECEYRASDGSARRLRVKRTPLVDTFANVAGELIVVQDITRLLELEERLGRGEAAVAALADVSDATAEPLELDAAAEDEEPRNGMVGTCAPMRAVEKLIDKVAPTDATVLVTGESGTGKELVARALHSASPRAKGPFVVVNCGAIPENLIESELFGHTRGAFTGAVADRPGLFRRAHGGTIFLDEIGELPLNLQVRLLRVLQDHMVMPVGGNASVPVDVRVVAATNRVLEDLVKQGQFREDLYFRLAVIAIALPPLRERGKDLERLIGHFVRQAAERHAKRVAGVSARAMHLLLRHGYPGNVRELENIVEHATTLADGETIRECDLPDVVREGARARLALPQAASPAPGEVAPDGAFSRPDGEVGAPLAASSPVDHASIGRDEAWGAVVLPIDEGEGASLDEQLERREKEMLLAALARASGVKKKAATLLGINYRSFRHRLQKYGLDGHDGDVVPRYSQPALPRESGH